LLSDLYTQSEVTCQVACLPELEQEVQVNLLLEIDPLLRWLIKKQDKNMIEGSGGKE
jgi:hypothetical protein